VPPGGRLDLRAVLRERVSLGLVVERLDRELDLGPLGVDLEDLGFDRHLRGEELPQIRVASRPGARFADEAAPEARRRADDAHEHAARHRVSWDAFSPFRGGRVARALFRPSYPPMERARRVASTFGVSPGGDAGHGVGAHRACSLADVRLVAVRCHRHAALARRPRGIERVVGVITR
jgi:hypothetical protein